ncbi:MAG: hypothetical protein OEW93_12095 [Candidatus Bathyarchaeota archaeon]|jgi:hypothetical protein|nr:hypothetical protein [Candidatus Bathyarchaeota archaeon]
MAEKRLGPEDEIKTSWAGELDGKNGFLMMSNKKLLFMQESGFLSKKYDFPLDLPYDRIREIKPESRNKLVLADAEDRKHSFVTYDMPVSRVEQSLRKLIELTKKPETPS